MQITKSHLKRIILEELRHFEEGVYQDPSGSPELAMVGDEAPSAGDRATSLLKAIVAEAGGDGKITAETLKSIETFLGQGASEPVPPTDGEREA